MSEENEAAINEPELRGLEAEVIGEINSDAAAVGDITAQAVAPLDEELRGLVGGVLGMGFSVLAPNWQVQQEEVEQLTEAYTALLCKYCPDGLGKYGVEISAVMMTFAVVAPRLGKPRNIPEPTAEPVPGELSDEAE